MASFPTLASGAVAREPLDRATVGRVMTLEFLDQSEQRWQDGKQTEKFRLRYDKLKTADKDTLETFFKSTKGGFDATWDFTLGGVTTTNCYFVSDEFSATETSEGLWTLSLEIAQRAT